MSACRNRSIGLVCLLAGFAGNAWGQAAAPVSTISAIDTLWVLICAFLVFFMQAGFAMLEAGMVRAKNAANVLLKNLMDFCAGSLGYFMVGFAFMYGGTALFVGTSGFFLIGAESPAANLPLPAFWIFQVVFAGTTATIVSGAVAERMRFTTYLAYSFLMTALLYPIIGHWIWGGGWLAQMGFHDFAGSTVVHTVGGVAALVGAKLLGPRIGRFQPDGSPGYIGAHNLPLAALGVFILWFGWFGFNPGSTLGLSDPNLVARIAVVERSCAGSSWSRSPHPTLRPTPTTHGSRPSRHRSTSCAARPWNECTGSTPTNPRNASGASSTQYRCSVRPPACACRSGSTSWRKRT